MQQDFITYLDKSQRIAELNKEIEKVELKLLSPDHTVQDIVRHMELLKELQNID